jgi:transposase
VATGAIDMRKGFNGLYGIVRNRFAMDPESGHLFLFPVAKVKRVLTKASEAAREAIEQL